MLQMCLLLLFADRDRLSLMTQSDFLALLGDRDYGATREESAEGGPRNELQRRAARSDPCEVAQQSIEAGTIHD